METALCQRCGAQAVPGGRLCMACALHADPQARGVGTPASSLLSLDEIQEKINRRGFIADRQWRWPRWGAFVGAPLGMLIAGVSVAGAILEPISRNAAPISVAAIVAWVMTALFAVVMGALVGGVGGAIFGVAAGNVYSFFRAIFLALFLKPNQFEREYGPAGGSTKSRKR